MPFINSFNEHKSNVGEVDVPRLAWPPAGNLVEFPDAIYSVPHKAAALQSQVHPRILLFQEPPRLGLYPILMWKAGSPLGVMPGAHVHPRPAATSSIYLWCGFLLSPDLAGQPHPEVRPHPGWLETFPPVPGLSTTTSVTFSFSYGHITMPLTLHRPKAESPNNQQRVECFQILNVLIVFFF